MSPELARRATAAERPSREAAWQRWLAASVLAAAFALAAITRADPDLWGHVRFGVDVLRTWSWASVDPYSFTQDRSWINHEWLAEAQMGLAWTVAGSAGLAVLKAALALLAWWLVWRATGAARLEARLGLTALAVIGTSQLTITLRPQLWSLVGVAIVCRLLTAGTPRRVVWLPLVFAVWANLHGGWLVGLGLVWVWTAAVAVGRPAAAGKWVSVAAASTLATLTTPYGWHLWTFMLETVRLGRPMIEEWQPLWALPPDKWLVWILGVVVFATVLWRTAPERIGPILAVAVLATISLRVARVVPLFIEAGAVLVAPLVARRWPRPDTPPLAVRTTSDRAVVGVAVAVALVTAGLAGTNAVTCIAVDDDPRMPESAPATLLAAAPPGRLVTFFNWGEYAIWHLGPRLRVSMDGRRETVYSDERLREHDAILAGAPDGLSTLSAWRPEYVWLPSTSGATREWLTGHGYRLAFDSARSFVAVRDDLPSLGRVEPPTAGPRCFPR